MSRVRSLDGGPPERAGAGGSRDAAVQPVRSTYRAAATPQAPRGARDPWLVVGVGVVAVLALGWRNNPSVAGSEVELGLRLVQLVVAALPVLGVVAWLSALLRTRHGGGGWGPASLVVAAGVWVLVLGIVLVLHGAEGDACAGLPRCTTTIGVRAVLGGVLAAAWVGARLLDGALVRRRAGVQWRAPTPGA